MNSEIFARSDAPPTKAGTPYPTDIFDRTSKKRIASVPKKKQICN
jgi:hypothetical protein